jgi:pyrroloquinoline quinone (PQQ) biosynthesis protein C
MAVIDQTVTSPFEEELNVLRRSNRLSQHPFVKSLLAGEATRDQLKVLAVEWYFHTVVFPNALANLLARCKIPQMRAALSESLYEEYTGLITNTKSHLDLFFDYTEALGITKEFLENNSYMTPGMGSLVNWYMYCTGQLDPLVGIASLAVAAEGQNVSIGDDPGASGVMVKALKGKYGFNDEQVHFWTVHDYADKDHSTAGIKLVVAYAKTDEQKAMVRAAIRHTQNCMWASFSDLTQYSWEEVTSNNCALFY